VIDASGIHHIIYPAYPHPPPHEPYPPITPVPNPPPYPGIPHRPPTRDFPVEQLKNEMIVGHPSLPTPPPPMVVYDGSGSRDFYTTPHEHFYYNPYGYYPYHGYPYHGYPYGYPYPYHQFPTYYHTGSPDLDGYNSD